MISLIQDLIGYI